MRDATGFANRVAGILTVTMAMVANADTIYVNGSCGDDAWTGASSVCSAPNGPKLTIQAGIDASVNGDTVIVADGVYIGVGNKNLDFGGRAISVRSEGGPAACIIDCENDGRGFYFHNAETADAVLDGFTIRNGSASDGGAIRCESSSPTILHCVLANSLALGRYGGGGLFSLGGNPTIRNCTISGNAALVGGGLLFDGGSPTVTDCAITGNWAFGTTFGVGGGMGNFGSSPMVSNCTIADNMADRQGGGMYNTLGASPTVTNCLIVGNTGRRGGGMYNAFGGSPTVTNCTIVGNSAAGGGGMYNLISSSRPVVSNCILWNNSPDEIVDNLGAMATVSFSDVQDGWPGSGNIADRPRFVNGGDGDFRLRPRSPCIDAADNTAVPAGILTDLDGRPRFVDTPVTPDTGVPGGAGGDAIVDMGAYEFPCDPCDMNCDGVVDAADIEFFIDLLFNRTDPCCADRGDIGSSGDVNLDGSINAEDIEGFINCLFP